MFFLDISTRNHCSLSLTITCPETELSFRGMTKEIMNHSFNLQVPTTRIKKTLTSFINKDVTIRVDNVLINGMILWYTIEGDYYIIGIEISKSYRSSWKEVLTGKSSLSLHPEIRHAAP
jgi:hypothetical protein